MLHQMHIFKTMFLDLSETGPKINAMKEIYNEMIKTSSKPECDKERLNVNTYNPHENGLARKLWEDCTRFQGPRAQDDPAEFLQNCLFTHLEENYSSRAVKELLKVISYQEEKIDSFMGREKREPLRNQYILPLTTGLDAKNDAKTLDLNTLINSYQKAETLEKYTDEVTGKSYNLSKQPLPKDIKPAEKRVELAGFGDYLLIQLKRIGFNKTTYEPFKYENKITSPVNLRIHDTNFQLQGAILHFGGAGGGHYVYGLLGKDAFYTISDTSVRRMNLDYAKSDEFYSHVSVLLYKKMSPQTAQAEHIAIDTIEAMKESLNQSEIADIARAKGQNLMLVDRLHRMTRKRNVTEKVLNLMKGARPITLQNIEDVQRSSANTWDKKAKELEKLHNIRAKQPAASKIKVMAVLPAKKKQINWDPFGANNEDPIAIQNYEKNLITFSPRIPDGINREIWKKVPQDYKNMWNSLNTNTKHLLLQQV